MMAALLRFLQTDLAYTIHYFLWITFFAVVFCSLSFQLKSPGSFMSFITHEVIPSFIHMNRAGFPTLSHYGNKTDGREGKRRTGKGSIYMPEET